VNLSKATYTLNAVADDGEVVGGIVALSTGLDKRVSVMTKDGKTELDLFEMSPVEIFVTVKKGKGVDQSTCDLLLKGKVGTPEAIEAITEYRKHAPKKRKWSKKKK